MLSTNGDGHPGFDAKKTHEPCRRSFTVKLGAMTSGCVSVFRAAKHQKTFRLPPLYKTTTHTAVYQLTRNVIILDDPGQRPERWQLPAT